jgi:tripartite-type tricarboxylate transporter receptor subunit TctC
VVLAQQQVLGRCSVLPGGCTVRCRRSHLALVILGAFLLLACAQPAPGAAPGGSSAAPSSGQAPAAPAKPAPAAAARAKPAATSPDYFAGKTITLMVNYSAGGPTDIIARLLAQYLDRYIPGRPTIVVENRVGAGGLVGKNHLYNVTRKDGYTVGVFAAVFGHQLWQSDSAQYDASQFLWLSGNAETSVAFVHSGLGIRNAQELARANQEIIAGGLAPDTQKDMQIRGFLNLLGTKYRYVTGYPGSADARLAFSRGEINYYEDTLTSWFGSFGALQREGQLTPIAQSGIVRDGQVIRDPRVANIPTYTEVGVELRGESARRTIEYRALAAMSQLGAMIFACLYPPGVDPAVAETLRRALADTWADPELLEAHERQLGFRPEIVPGAEAQRLAEKLIQSMNEDPEALEYLRRLAREKQG